MASKNNVIRLLDSRKIEYEAFELPTEKLGAPGTAAMLGVPAEEVFKTIVILREGKGKPLLALIPGGAKADLKKVARAIGEKKVSLPTEKQAEAITGLQAGGISPLALLNKGFQVVIDRSAQEFKYIHVSGGMRGLNIRLPVAALAEITRAVFADIALAG